MIIRNAIVATLLVCCLCSCSQSNEPDNPKPKNVILLIGDGMGLSQVSSAFYFQDTPTNFKRFTTVGLIQTSSSSHKITDSAAGATAFSAGVQTFNGAIAVDKDTIATPTILELLSQSKSTGLIATSSITHATPGSFYAHVDSRKKDEEIASFLHKSEIDFIAGGGLKYFNQRLDGINYLDSLELNGYQVTTMNGLSTPKSNKRAIFLADDALAPAIERGSYLRDITLEALAFLRQDQDGFVLVIEGSQIDWGGHANDAEYLIDELIDFDKTIGAVLDFAEQNPETLVVVTADHETGGFTLAGKKRADGSNDYDEIAPTFSTDGHSASLIPVFAYGAGAEKFGGVGSNYEIFHRIMNGME